MAESKVVETTIEQPVTATTPDERLSDEDLARVSGGIGSAGFAKMEVEPVDFKPKGSLMGMEVEPVDFKPRPGF